LIANAAGREAFIVNVTAEQIQEQVAVPEHLGKTLIGAFPAQMILRVVKSRPLAF